MRFPTNARQKRYYRKDAAQIWGAVTGALVRCPDGRPDFFISTIENITKAKEAEMAVETALVSSEHLRLALAAGQMGTWEIDHAREVRNHSLETRAIFGWQPDEPLPWSELLSQLLPEDRPALTAAQERLRAGDNEASVEYRIRRTDGEIRVAERQRTGRRSPS